jgi:hypothetical protein
MAAALRNLRFSPRDEGEAGHGARCPAAEIPSQIKRMAAASGALSLSLTIA